MVHHPSGIGIPNHPVPRFDIAVKDVFFKMLHQNTASSMYNRFRCASGSGGVKNVSGVVERNAGEFQITIRTEIVL